jgi:hypothetical protein
LKAWFLKSFHISKTFVVSVFYNFNAYLKNIEPEQPVRKLAAAICSIDDVFVVTVEQMRKFVSELNNTNDLPQIPLSPDQNDY